MPLITEEQLRKVKKSDTIIIYGCGSSINDITDMQYEDLKGFESCGFNWFCFSGIPTTYYIVREQANIPKRVHGKETISNFYQEINDGYKQSCLVIHDLKNHSPKAFDYSDPKNCKRFLLNYVIVNDIKLDDNNPGVEKWKNENIFKSGVYHGKNTLTNALHFSVWMRYKRIIFVGVDLYDSRYFWLDDDETRYSVKSKNKDAGSRHQTATDVISLVKRMKKCYPKIKMYTYNKKSLLANYIGVWNG